MTLPAGWKPGADAREYDSQTPTDSDQDIPVSEQIIWQNEVKQGIINKKVVETQTLTNLRVMRNSFYVALNELDDIVTMNRHNVRQGTYVSTGRYVRVGSGTSNSKSVGDVVFVQNGKPVVVFHQIGDPAGLVRLAKAARKGILDRLKAEEKFRKSTEKAASKPAGKKSAAEKSIICNQCSNENPADAKFCNGCGKSLTSACPKCQKVNAQGASFCAECGLPLS